MRRLTLLLSTSALACVSHAALAADLGPMRPYAPMAPAAYISPSPSWTGWYLGGNLGYAFGRANSDITIPGSTVDTGAPAGVVDVPGSKSSKETSLDGLVGGAQAGFNWQVTPRWLLGVETDFQRTGQKGSRSVNDAFASTVLLPDVGVGAGDCPCDVTGTSSLRYHTDLRWFGTMRGRVGVLSDRMLFYGTGGFAYGKFDVDGKHSSTVTVTDDLGATAFTDTSSNSFFKSRWKGGWTVGAGVEGMAWDPRWTWKAEYLYLDFGKVNVNAGAGTGETMRISTKFTDHIGRLGLNYRF